MDRKSSSDNRFALLIDADNVSARYIKPILDELSKYGTVTVKRIYGDWTLPLHSKWKDALLENSIMPIQQFGYTQGKNATDSAMIIDAMDLLYGENLDGFCIVSSDSDFTRLAGRLRESGLTVIGMGEKKTPTPFRRACDVFTNLELLAGPSSKQGGVMHKQDVEQAVVDIITENLNNGKATGLGEVGSRMLKRYPDFDVRNYGTNLLSKLLDEFDRVKITKDHSNVTVELVESTKPESTAEYSEDVSDDDTKKEPDERKRARRRRSRKIMAEQEETPQAYIYKLVRESGTEGIPLASLGNKVRDRFKDFKVRDLGFAQMRRYVASVGDFEIMKEGRSIKVRLAQ
ncbi:NYN domain-containing protein [Adlercreutzia sp. ZJ154]|uniref:NYN domain-containing protein n=1 Tax=Adlercreutzia sp. ZJ154 TaxID=2709790 RepID=UPI0013EB6266|nr:NYN domain-containing protein [Adlercreutzia sp. ZJ154]